MCWWCLTDWWLLWWFCFLVGTYIYICACGMIGLSFEPHQCLVRGMLKRSAQVPCWPPNGQQVSHQGWISGNVWHVRLNQVRIRLLIQALKPWRDITRSPKQGYQWPHEKDLCAPKIKKKSSDLAPTYWATIQNSALGPARSKIPIPFI